jgi:hypothetical protein
MDLGTIKYPTPRKKYSNSGHYFLLVSLITLTQIFHESLAATTDMAVLPGVLGCRVLRRTVQVRLGFDFGFWILDLGFLRTINDI